MLARQSEIVCGAALIIIFCLLHIVALRVVTLTICVSILTQLIEDMLHLNALTTIRREPDTAQECSETHVIGVLIVLCLAQIVGLVVGDVIGTKHIILHILQRAVSITVIDTAVQSKRLTACCMPSLRQTG